MVKSGDFVEYVRNPGSVVSAIVVDIHRVYFYNNSREFIGQSLYDIVTLEKPIVYVVDVQKRKLITKGHWEKFFEDC